MYRFIFTFVFILAALPASLLYGNSPGFSGSVPVNINLPDTLKENQILYNGRIWRNLYYSIKGDQFLFSKEALSGSVTIDGKTFNNIRIRYDIYTDEVMIPANNGSILQLNKEMVDSFTINFQDKTYRFINIHADTLKGFKGYFNVLNTGKTRLFVKYKKEIDLIAVDEKYDLFFQTHRIYFVKDNILSLITNRKEFLNHFGDYNVQIKSFIKKNRLKLLKKNPESYVPVVQYYNSLKQ